LSDQIAVLLSGGVDSSVALSLLKQQGHEPSAFYLKVWLEDELESTLGSCPWEEDIRYARAVCEQLEVPLEIVPCQRAYWEQVIEEVLAELRAGRTPSPDLLCNQRIKFGAFLDLIPDSFERVASGHYARLEVTGDQVLLKRAQDPVKDQTYFLARLSQAQLRRALFPLGDLAKAEVRERASALDLPTAARPDSQGICFLGKVNYRDFIRYHLGERPGPIIDVDGARQLGEHRGYWFHTIGQRQGLGLSQGPWYVCGKDVDKNAIYVAHGDQREQHASATFTIEAMSWTARPVRKRRLQLKLRHGPRLIEAELDWQGDGATVRIVEPDSGIAPGQYAVLYDGDICLGAARIV